MIFRSIWLVTLLLFGGISSTVGQYQATIKSLKIGDLAPKLAIAKWLKGSEITEFKKGRIYVVEFWATWCGPCIAGMPHLSELAEKYSKDVTVIGCSILEKKETTLADVEKFVVGNTKNMRYHVAAENGSEMSTSWHRASGGSGIPNCIVVDRDGRIAWTGHPGSLKSILPKIIAGKWNLNTEAEKLEKHKQLGKLDGNEMVMTLNSYMGRPGNPIGGLVRIDSFLRIEPDLKYYPKMGHFTFVCLARTDESKAIQFAKDWFAANPDGPGYSTVTDVVSWLPNPSPTMLKFAADCYQGQLDKYPWSMIFKDTYTKMAALYRRSGDEKRAIAFEQKAAKASSTLGEHN